MKNSIKKKLIVICAASAMILSTAVSVFAATAAPATVRPMPGSAGSQTTSSGTTSGSTSVTSSGTSASDETSTSGEGDYRATDNQDGSGVSRPVPTALATAPEATMNVVSSNGQATVDGKKYVSRGGMFGWFILSILVNAIISFWIGNRFYRLARKDSHVTTEIRALRRDVEEKFLNSVGGFAEQEMDVSNSNEDYSSDDDGIVMPQRQYAERTPETDDVFKKWESQMNTRSASAPRNSRRSNVEGFDEFEQSMRRKKYQPVREEVEEDDTEEYEEENSKSGLGSVTSKAKEFLGDIFPFKED